MMFWIPPCLLSSITTTQITPHPETEAIPVAAIGCQGPPLKEGVLSGIFSHHSHRPRCSPEPNHPITNCQHLVWLITIPISLHSTRSHIVWSTVCYAYLPDSLPVFAYFEVTLVVSNFSLLPVFPQIHRSFTPPDHPSPYS